MNKPTQKQRLLEYLVNHGSINPLESWQRCGIYRLAARVRELRQDGHNITSTMIDVESPFGNKVKTVVYEYHE